MVLLLYVALVAFATLIARSDAISAATEAKQDHDSGRRFFRIQDTSVQGDYYMSFSHSGSFSGVVFPSTSASGSDDEERDAKISSSIADFFTSKTISSAITNLLKNNNKTKMTPAKLRVKLLESLPPEQAAKLIFIEMPTNLPAKLPPKVPTGVKAQVFKIPGVSSATIRAKMAVWYYYRLPPTYVFKELGLVGQISQEALHKHPNYKYFKSYFYKWVKSQPVM